MPREPFPLLLVVARLLKKFLRYYVGVLAESCMTQTLAILMFGLEL